MTEADQINEQEKLILKLRAEKAQLETRVANLQRMHDGAQRQIGVLQRLLEKQKSTLADKVFSNGSG